MPDQFLPIEETRQDLPERRHFPEGRRVNPSVYAKRQFESASARMCAHAAASKLGIEECAIPSGTRGEPDCPAGVVGSITRPGNSGAGAASTVQVMGVGTDRALLYKVWYLPIHTRLDFEQRKMQFELVASPGRPRPAGPASSRRSGPIADDPSATARVQA